MSDKITLPLELPPCLLCGEDVEMERIGVGNQPEAEWGWGVFHLCPSNANFAGPGVIEPHPDPAKAYHAWMLCANTSSEVD